VVIYLLLLILLSDSTVMKIQVDDFWDVTPCNDVVG